ncbi:MAG: putative Holliday junction resolvase [Planctomycetota bacterium]|jgi:putative Holliday junction resolvase
MTSSPPRMGALGVDHGSKRTGFAATDPLRLIVTPLDAPEGGDPAALKELAKLLDERDISHLVVGYPLNMDGTKGGRAADVDRFITKVEDIYPELAIVRQDERLSTKEAEQRLREAGYHGKDRKVRRDPWSAMVLLEDWIREGEPD